MSRIVVTPPTLPVGVYAGVALDQNALTYVLFARWVSNAFFVEISDLPTIDALLALAPPGVIPAADITGIRIFPVRAPRLDISVEGIVEGTRPLIAYFDDIRTCFGTFAGEDQRFTSLFELAFNAETLGTIVFNWPSLVSVVLDAGATATTGEIRAWEFFDPGNANVMTTIQPNGVWTPLVNQLIQKMLSPNAAPPLTVPVAPPAWMRLLPNTQQEVFAPANPPAGVAPQDIYAEILGRRRALYALPAVRTLLLQLVDGSGAPLLNLFIGNAPPLPPKTLATLNCGDGTTLRGVLDLINMNSVFPT